MSNLSIFLKDLPNYGASRDHLRKLRDDALFMRTVCTYAGLAITALLASGLYQPVKRGELSLLVFILGMAALCWACYNVVTNIRQGCAAYAHMVTECDDVGLLNHITQLSEECSTVKRCIKSIMETSGRQKLYWYEVDELLELGRKERLSNALYQAQENIHSAVFNQEKN